MNDSKLAKKFPLVFSARYKGKKTYLAIFKTSRTGDAKEYTVVDLLLGDYVSRSDSLKGLIEIMEDLGFKMKKSGFLQKRLLKRGGR